jgi:acyl-CoA reductase-like NAD-dependent aldehyde dehydrogenase
VLLEEHIEELAYICSREVGKNLDEARGANWPVLYSLVRRRSASTEASKAPTGVSVTGVEPTLDLQSNDPLHFSST